MPVWLLILHFKNGCAATVCCSGIRCDGAHLVELQRQKADQTAASYLLRGIRPADPRLN